MGTVELSTPQNAGALEVTGVHPAPVRLGRCAFLCASLL
jgi:hypothetical protein